MRDQGVRYLRGEGQALGGIFDGTGEAKLDLMPGSTFLKELNQRRLPDSIAVTSIVGTASPWQPAEIPALSQTADPEWSAKLAAWGASLADVAAGLGDGAVSLA